MRDKQEILRDLAGSVVSMDEKKAAEVAQEALESDVGAYAAISAGLVKGMETMGANFEKGTVFVPELLLASEALYAGLDILKPHLKGDSIHTAGRVVIGVVQGDTHDIGKNLVKLMMEAGGFEMFDLGRDVPIPRFVEAALERDADLICLSTLMTTTMRGMQEVVDLLTTQGVRNRFKVLIGGAPVSRSFARQIGADGYAANAASAVRIAKELVREGVSTK